MLLPDKLVESINTRRCFALVGAGPSCEIGYPSWKQFAEKTFELLQSENLVKDPTYYQKFLSEKKYPELFRQAEIDYGGKKKLLTLLKKIMVPPPSVSVGRVYRMLARWPFACYLTTNYDDELYRHLQAERIHFETVRNTKEDLALIRNGVSNLIVKLHSDFAYPEGIVLTSEDYNNFETNPHFKYFRDHLTRIFTSFDIFIIGYSLADRDLDLILKFAKQISSPTIPIYMIAADFNQADQREFREKYNIQVTTYPNSDGKHTQLYNVLGLIDGFITYRKDIPRRLLKVQQPSEEEVEVAASLFIYTRLQKENIADSREFLGPLILKALEKTKESGIALDEIFMSEPFVTLKCDRLTRGDSKVVVEHLASLGFITYSSGVCKLTREGEDYLKQILKHRKIEEEQAIGQFAVEISERYFNMSNNQLSDQQLGKAKEHIKQTLVRVFKTRGMVIAKQVFANLEIVAGELTDLFREVSRAASEFEDTYLSASFVFAARTFLLEPTAPQKNYLASVSQGYFLYHLMGLDPVCSSTRKKLFETTAWLFDSSVLLRLLAKGSYNHEFAVDLFERLTSNNAAKFTTKMLLKETWGHFQWAIELVKKYPETSTEFLSAAIGIGTYKQNLFIDGYIRMKADGAVVNFDEYLEMIAPAGPTEEALYQVINELGAKILSLDEFQIDPEKRAEELAMFEAEIERERTEKGIYRSQFQVQAEAEVLYLIKYLRETPLIRLADMQSLNKIYFVSDSKILDRLPEQKEVVTWSPEALYRYLLTLPTNLSIEPDLLQECMLQSFYYAGLNFIDRTRYEKFFGSMIDFAEVKFDEQKEKYYKAQEAAHLVAGDVEQAFDKISPLERPFFVSQMNSIIARDAELRAEVAEKRAEKAEDDLRKEKAKIRNIVEEKEDEIKRRKRAEHEAGRQRNLRDPKHLKKRERQKKKRRKEKKK